VSRLLYLAYDQLHRAHGVLANADPSVDEVIMIESASMLGSRRWHAQRLHFLLASAAHFRADLEAEGFTVHHIHAETMRAGLERFRGREIVASAPTSHGALAALERAGVRLVPSDFFLTPRATFDEWSASQNRLVMENFYRWQRRRLGILMEGSHPVGGTWNLDSENRLPPPRGSHPWPEPLHHDWDAIDDSVQRQVMGLDGVIGAITPGMWGTSRAAALRQLENFLAHGLAEFGPYEDAMPRASWNGYHSLLSPYLNNGLLHPREVVNAALERHAEGDIPLASIEGFIRQVIGWREYVNGLYWHFGVEYRRENGLNARRTLLPLFEDPSRTSMECVRSVVGDVHDRAWVHHIPRLMVLANLGLLSGVDPGEFLDWMRRMFIDAADWVMVPNVIGMGLHADGGVMMTKPYAAGGAYIKRMGQYCGSCSFRPDRRTGEDACPFTTLYWDFLDRHRATFEGNHRLSQQLRGLDRLSDLAETRARAADVLDRLEQGTL
jgi:deoxyribodipyrimidine photolyase-related protein